MLRITPAEKPLASSLSRVVRSLRGQFRAQDRFIGKVLAQAAAGQGKRLRARLTLLSAQALGLRGPRVERLAMVFELLHQASLVHDDVIDGSGRRRHRTTLNVRFGNAAAVLAGDLIFTKAVRQLAAGDYPDAVQDCVVRAATAVCLGELQELRHQHDAGMTLTEYFTVVGNKTASLLSAACESAAALAHGTRPQVAALARYGREFGKAFQIRDDLLDLSGRPLALGKPVGQDLAAGRMTLPVILGLRHGASAQRRRVAGLVRTQERDPRRWVAALTQSGVLAQAQALALRHARLAQAALRTLPPSPARAALHALAEFAVTRKD
jgi:octaprenyl-diphosphate synthase